MTVTDLFACGARRFEDPHGDRACIRDAHPDDGCHRDRHNNEWRTAPVPASRARSNADALLTSILTEYRRPLPMTIHTADGDAVTVDRIGDKVLVGGRMFGAVNALDLSAAIARAATPNQSETRRG